MKVILGKKEKRLECFPELIPLLICKKKRESVALGGSLFYHCWFSIHDFTASGTDVLWQETFNH